MDFIEVTNLSEGKNDCLIPLSSILYIKPKGENAYIKLTNNTSITCTQSYYMVIDMIAMNSKNDITGYKVLERMYEQDALYEQHGSSFYNNPTPDDELPF